MDHGAVALSSRAKYERCKTGASPYGIFVLAWAAGPDRVGFGLHVGDTISYKLHSSKIKQLNFYLTP